MSNNPFCILCKEEILSFHARAMVNRVLLPIHQSCYDNKVDIAICQNVHCGKETPVDELNFSGIIRLCPKCGSNTFELWI
jgi:hypothetical protein